MKKVALSLAGVLAAAAFAPEASALPVFARQTGMACSACHFQHFPLLNGFGRAFKAGGFTMMGSQGKVEGDNLGIPAELNFAGLASMGYEKSNMLPYAGTTTGGLGVRNTGDGSVYVPGTNGEMSLFFGGHISDNAGFLAEWGAIGGAGLGSAKLPILFDVGDNKAGIVAFTTGSQGASYGFEYLNTGANAIHSITNDVGFQNQFINAVSAQQYIGTSGAATGAAIVANGTWGFVNVTKFHQVGPGQIGGPGNTQAALQPGTGAMLGSTYLRLAATFDLAGWDAAAGVQNWSGSSTSLAGPGMSETKANAVDFQMQGAAGEMPLGIYVTWASAPAPTLDGNGNPVASTYNPGGTDARSAINVAAELGVIPERVTVGAAIRSGKSGQTVNDAGGNVLSTNASDNAIMLTATYKFYQNQLVRLSYVHQSGDYWDGYVGGVNNSDAMGATSYRLSLYSLF